MREFQHSRVPHGIKHQEPPLDDGSTIDVNTVVVCALTSNLRRATAPGNVLLEPGEANLPQQSVVNVSQIFTVDKAQLSDKIGTLSARRVRNILNGIRLLTEPRELEKHRAHRTHVSRWPHALGAMPISSQHPASGMGNHLHVVAVGVWDRVARSRGHPIRTPRGTPRGPSHDMLRLVPKESNVLRGRNV